MRSAVVSKGSGDFADRANFLDKLRIFSGRKRLCGIRKGKLGMVVNLDHEAIGPNCHASPSERRDHVVTPRAMGWIDDYRQMRNSTNRWHRREVERVACMLRESANTSLA